MEFQEFPKIARFNREIVITEKIDGTNSQIVFNTDGTVYIGSRNRWITPENDNFGFARWVTENVEQLREELGYGQHFGEWWGAGIQRRYGLDHKRFSLFNTTRWKDAALKLCHVVPELYRGLMAEGGIVHSMETLRQHGSVAAPGFMDPEGIVIFHTAANQPFKITLKNDETPKSLA